MAHKDRDHDLVHCENHGGRGTSSPEHVTYIDHVGDAGPLPSKIGWHQHVKQALCSRDRERLRGKSSIPVDRVSVFCCFCAGDLSPELKIIRATLCGCAMSNHWERVTHFMVCGQ
jgi:hypothetical protein